MKRLKEAKKSVLAVLLVTAMTSGAHAQTYFEGSYLTAVSRTSSPTGNYEASGSGAMGLLGYQFHPVGAD